MGNFRIGLSINTLQKANADILWQLILCMAVILIISFTRIISWAALLMFALSLPERKIGVKA